MLEETVKLTAQISATHAAIRALRDEVAAYRAFVEAVRVPASGVQTIHNVTDALAALARLLGDGESK